MSIKVIVRKKPGRKLQMAYVDPLTGRDVCRSAKTNDWKEAERRAAKWEEEVNAGNIGTGITWDAFRTRFRREHLSSLAPKSRGDYDTGLNTYEKVMGKPRKLAGITPSVLSEYRGRLKANGLSLATIATYLGLLQSALSWAKTLGLIPYAPKIKLPPIPDGHMKGRPLSPDEVKRYREEVEKVGADLVRMFDLLLLSGMRLGEAVTLDWEKPPVRVDMTGGRYPRIVFDVEGHKGHRKEIMPLAPDFIAWLQAVPERARKGRVCPIDSRRDKGKLLAVDTIEGFLTAAGVKSGIRVSEKKFVSAHDLRRTFGTKWAMHVKPAVLQRMMRHRTIATSMKYYVSLDADEMGDVLNETVLPTRTPAAQSRSKSRPNNSRKSLKKSNV